MLRASFFVMRAVLTYQFLVLRKLFLCLFLAFWFLLFNLLRFLLDRLTLSFRYRFIDLLILNDRVRFILCLILLTGILFLMFGLIILSNEHHPRTVLNWLLLTFFFLFFLFYFLLICRMRHVLFIFVNDLSHLCEGFESLVTAAVPIFFDVDCLFLGFENVHELLDLTYGTLFRFVLIHIWQVFKNDLDITDSLRQYLVDLLLDGWTAAPKWPHKYLTGSQGEFLPISKRAYKLLMWYSERKI